MSTKHRSAASYERQQEYIKKWQQRNRARLAERSKQQRQTLRIAALKAYSGDQSVCFCCSTAYVDHLTVAAMDGDVLFGTSGHSGTSLYRKLAREGYPPGYRVLCWNCLMARSLYHACPHEVLTAKE